MSLTVFTPEQLLEHDKTLIAQTVAETLRQIEESKSIHDKTPVSLAELAKQNGYKLDTYRRIAKKNKIDVMGRPGKIERRI